MLIRKMKRGDVPGVYEIERECFMSEAWAIEDFYALTEDLPYCAALVAEEDGKPVGYIAMSFAADEADIASVAVSGEYRRQGIAKRLISEAIGTVKPARVFLEVRASNTAAQELYKSLGFRYIGVRRGYYTNPPEDAAVMRKDCVE